MINFRFHLISLVAVFLALGVGVAMGASFIDRATVDSLRGRVDDLDAGFRERGERIARLDAQLAQQDRQAEALAGAGSEALDARLRGQPVVLVVPDGLPEELLEPTRESLAAAGADLAGTVRILPAVTMEDEGVVRRVRDALEVRSGNDRALRTRVVDDLGTALGLLGAGSTAPAAGDAAAPEVPGTSLQDVADARLYLATLENLDVIRIEAGDAAPGTAFPEAGPFRYVELLGGSEGIDAGTVMVPLAESLSAQAPLTLTVAAGAPVREEGTATTTTEPSGTAAALGSLREGEVAERLSTVDDLQEAFGRIALVYAVAQQRDDRLVGHYGTAPGATAPFPTVPAG